MPRSILQASITPRRSSQLSDHVKYLLSISRELNGERDIDKLLSLILDRSCEVTHADAGSLYIVEREANRPAMVRFKLARNDSVPQSLRETAFALDDSTVVGRSILWQTAIHTRDMPKQETARSLWEERTGYECRSMLTVPMFDISHQVIGVIQLINRKRTPSKKLLSRADFDNEVIPFESIEEEYASIVAQQAGIALENAQLTQEVQNVLEGFVHASVTAIEQRDPTTSGHSHRVATLTVELARQVDRMDSGPFARTCFTADELKEIQYASLLHDFGKLGVRESVLIKEKKLFSWQRDLLMERFELARASYEIEYLRQCLATVMKHPRADLSRFAAARDLKLSELEKFLEVILKANEPTVLEQGGFELLQQLASRRYKDRLGNDRELLRPDELSILCVSKGSLTHEEFGEIQAHVVHTYNFLKRVPWGRTMAGIPEIAGKHHEKLDGSGYPEGLRDKDIPIQSRMMTIVDIYDALTASDRPYKKSVPAERALDILSADAKRGKLDSELLAIFIQSGVYSKLSSDMD